MRNFLLNHTKRYTVKTFQQPEQFKKEFFKQFREKLKMSYVESIAETENEISFKAPVARFAWNGWNVFNPISKGSVRLTDNNGNIKIEYNFCFKEFFFIALLMSFSGIVALYSNQTQWGYAILIADWLGFYVISRIISAFRLNSFIAGIVQTVNNPKAKNNDFDKYLKEEWQFIDKVFFEKHYRDAVG